MYEDDDTHITGQITFSQIAEAIRHKKYGVDMREAIAQGFEQYNDENEISDLHSSIQALNQRCDNIEEKHNEDIKAAQEQLDRLNHAVFGYGEFEVNYQKPSKQRPDDSEINYRKPLNIEIETEQDHKKGENL